MRVSVHFALIGLPHTPPCLPFCLVPLPPSNRPPIVFVSHTHKWTHTHMCANSGFCIWGIMQYWFPSVTPGLSWSLFPVPPKSPFCQCRYHILLTYPPVNRDLDWFSILAVITRPAVTFSVQASLRHTIRFLCAYVLGLQSWMHSSCVFSCFEEPPYWLA